MAEGGARPRVDVSVVLGVRNGADHIAEQLRALEAQELDGTWELLVVDDGSTDATATIVASYADRLPLRVLATVGTGSVASARNLGAHEATGQNLIFLDHDDVVTPGYLAAMGAALADSEVAAARLDLDALNPGWVASFRPPVQQVGLSDGLFPFGAGASLGAQRRAFEALGGFATTVGSAEDRDLCFRAALAGMKVTFVTEAVLQYRYRASPSAIFRQARRGGRSSAFLYAAYGKHGMRPRLVRNEIAKGIRALAGLVGARDIGTRAQHAHRLGAVVGYVEGSVRRRVAYLRWRLPHAA